MNLEYSNYIVYVDESGDFNLSSIAEDFPVFVLAFCIFKKSHYTEFLVPELEKLKFRWFGHNSIVLHEREIRKDIPPFHFLKTIESKNRFLGEISDVVHKSDMLVTASVIDKRRLLDRYKKPENPYHLSLIFCMERLKKFLDEKGEGDKKIHILFEKRGKREDSELKAEFELIREGRHYFCRESFPNFEIEFVSKQANLNGLQIADLLARPVGLSVVRPDQRNRSMDIIWPKIIADGLKIFPSESEKPQQS